MKKRMVVRFKRNTVDKPIVYRLVRDYDLVFNILRANVSPKAESMMVIEMEGEEENFHRGLQYLKGFDIGIEPIEQDINRREALKIIHLHTHRV